MNCNKPQDTPNFLGITTDELTIVTSHNTNCSVFPLFLILKLYLTE